ncbi:MAG: dihydrolipoyl dehydrogenase [Candidatus Saelkia tenebricola]|nr:dihydrolipoyl dehydrogenase [Candidatus Saelkia tenebricola]
MKNFNLAIIGAGSGGYTAALLASQKGLKVLLAEENNLGGVCLNSGCIPTKFLLHKSGVFSSIKDVNNYGIEIEGLNIDYRKLKEKKDDLVSSLRGGVEFLLRKRGVEVVKARAKIVSQNELLLKYEDKEKTVRSDNIIIATGSSPLELKGMEFDHSGVMSSESILNLESLPESLLIVGGGVVGVEFATHFAHLGVKVYLIEAMSGILPKQDKEISNILKKALIRIGVEIHTSTKVQKIEKNDGSIHVALENGLTLNPEKILVAVSRAANIEGLWQNVDINIEHGFIKVNSNMRTNIKNIYAIGDVLGGFMLAHSASYEAKVSVSNILGQEKLSDYSSIPICIYTSPEIATVGLSEEEAKRRGIIVKIAKFPFIALGKARAVSKTDGFVKLIADSKGKVLLGANLVGPSVTEIVSELTLAIRLKIPCSELLEVIHPHPTISEAIQEALEILNDTPINFI